MPSFTASSAPSRSSSTSPSTWPPLRLPLTDLLAGSAAGAAQVIVGQPLDTVRVRMQTAPRGAFKGTWDVLVQTIRFEGVRGLFKGMASPLLGISAQNSLLFTAFALSKRLISPSSTQLSVAQTAAAGSIAGGANAILASPVELFKIRLQTQYTHSAANAEGTAATQKLSVIARDLWNQHGLACGVMRGFQITFFREILAYAGFYGAFAASKLFWQRQLLEREPAGYAPSASYSQTQQTLPIWALMASGSMGGIANWLACYPLDVIKSRVQQSTAPLPRAYILHYFRTIARDEGPSAFGRGLMPTLLRAIPAAAATFTTYELVKGMLES
ncbi:mitochondrial carrier [Tilletiaria anomala UBC 951]|uniref:Mitochondrial carrier n=1 Tax=Tilletiaria anomala (strain ATCC 24038 / CBS 436.72 / UBC 951) TaxID=1037660 RepID=A0A066VZ22_TILAU|nr:mitochondrial carrier [Tilletiaria anomala UBC 951]KDN46967.1 mitochondrial carrier [Tilletiaria anomala UBC 951]